MAFVKGTSGNVKGRPKGIIDKRLRLNKSLMGDGDALLAVTTAAAMAGDMTAMSLLLPRMMPTLKPEGSPIRFALDATQDAAKQIEQVLQAMADGQITVEEAGNIANMIHVLAEARAEGGASADADRLIQAFKDVALQMSGQDGMTDPKE